MPQYAPATPVEYAVSNSALTAFDAVNLSLTFTATGTQSLVHASGLISAPLNIQVLIGLVNTVPAQVGPVAHVLASDDANLGPGFALEFLLTTVATTSYTVNLAGYASGIGALLRAGGTNAGLVNNFGFAPVTMWVDLAPTI